MTDRSKMPDADLADAADAGLGGQGNIVEAMRRLRESTDNASRWMIALTGVLVVLTAVLVWIGFLLLRQGP